MGRSSPEVLQKVAETVAIGALDAIAVIAGEGEEGVVAEDEAKDTIDVGEVEEEVAEEGWEEVVGEGEGEVAGEDEGEVVGEDEGVVAAVVKTNVMNAPIVLLLMAMAAVMFEEGEAAVVSWDEGTVEVEAVESVTLLGFLVCSMPILLLVGYC